MDFWQKAGREHLPWRRDGITAYEVWVSEIMLQQTQVSRVIEYYTRFLKRFPTVHDLAVTSWEEFLPYYAGLGYYRRGRNMIEAAKKVVNEHDGEFPRDKKLLMKLPGVGDYTASAILSFAYGDNHLAWDTNLKRVIGRFFFGSKRFFDELRPDGAKKVAEESVCRSRFVTCSACSDKRLSGENVSSRVQPCSCEVSASRDDNKRSRNKFGMTASESSGDVTSRDIFESVFKSSKRDFNAALMDFGSAICTGRPKCGTCPLQRECRYFRTSGGEEGLTNKILRQAQDDNVLSAAGKTDWRKAQVFLWLHENHKRYYSSHSKHFEPFVIPSGYNSRAGIKKYFQEKYSLELAVRPPHKKVLIEGRPTLFVNAQILLGEPGFIVFSPEKVREYAEKQGW